MAKATTQFVCSECGYASPKWLGRCPDCGKFNTLIEEAIAPAPTAKKQNPLQTCSQANPIILGYDILTKLTRITTP